MESKVKLKDLTLKIGSGSTPRGGKEAYLDNSEISLIRSQNIYNHYFEPNGLAYISEEQAFKLRNVDVQENDILINITGDSVARNMVVDPKYLPARVNQHVSIIRCDTSKLDPYYLSALLTSEKMQSYLLSIGQTGGTRAALTKKMLEELEIPLFEIKLQNFIGIQLKLINEKVNINNEIINTLEQLAQTLFKRWFVDFEFPNENGEPYKSNGGEMVESDLGGIPKGWVVIDLGDLSRQVSKGTTPSKKDFDGTTDNKDIEFLKVKDINNDGLINFNNVEKIPNVIHLGRLKRSVLEEKDILLSIAGTIGRLSYIDSIRNGININQAIAFIRLRDIEKHFVFIYSYLKTDEFQNDIKSKVVQGVQANVSLSVIKSTLLIMPSNEVLDLYNKIVSPIIEEIESVRTENEKLVSLRDTLLPKLLSGEIELPDEIEVTDDVPIS